MIGLLDGVLTPKYAITVDGTSINSVLNARLMSLNLIDNRGFDADTLTMVIDDSDGLMELPKRGVVINVKIGFNFLVDRGDFKVDAVSHTGAPDIITISAKSADFRGKLLEPKNKAYHQKTIKEIVEEIADQHQLKSMINEELGNIKIHDRQQRNESDANFLTRLANDYDAIATVKKGTILFIKRGESKTASGKDLPIITITRKQGDNHSYSVNDRDSYTGVKAKYTTNASGERKEVLAGDEEKTKMLRRIYKSEADAQDAAENELKKLKRGVASFS
ncbi:contractile injection system protein, VgrG/Pvc8 family, partial [Wohlfahrtiimonas larvae]|uniref:contractile injection system protein, VgrG/Pvc8 family n=1 Tax=Wohlfahrtiimonas larvae TaxID=1157986 RepID=UPI0031F174E4